MKYKLVAFWLIVFGALFAFRQIYNCDNRKDNKHNLQKSISLLTIESTLRRPFPA